MVVRVDNKTPGLSPVCVSGPDAARPKGEMWDEGGREGGWEVGACVSGPDTVRPGVLTGGRVGAEDGREGGWSPRRSPTSIQTFILPQSLVHDCESTF